MLEWGAVYAAGKQVIEGLKALNKMELAAQVTDLLGALNDARSREMDLLNRISDLEREKGELERRLAARDELTYRDGVYWKDGDDAPFCAACHDQSIGERRSRLRAEPWGPGRTRYFCPVCKNIVLVPPEDPRREQVRIIR